MVKRKLFFAALAAVVVSCGVLPSVGASAFDRSVRVAATPSVVRPPRVGGCQVFPATNRWNQDISHVPARGDSAALVRTISATGGKTMLHPDFGGHGAYGIPFKLVPANQKRVPIHYTAYGNESDPGPFPMPRSTPTEGGSDSHAIVLQEGSCHLFELYAAHWNGSGWDAASGTNWNLSSNKLRPLGWTSADAAGLPIFPGLVRYGEVADGAVRHALRFTVEATQRGYILPATHYASSSNDPSLPAMGLRLRLKGHYSLARFHGQSLVILKALKRFGMIVADNGSSWYITGAADPRWNDNDLNQLKSVPGSAFEAVNTGPIQH